MASASTRHRASREPYIERDRPFRPIFEDSLRRPKVKSEPGFREIRRIEGLDLKKVFLLTPEGSRCQIRNLRAECCTNQWSRARLVAIKAVSWPIAHFSHEQLADGHPPTDHFSERLADVLQEVSNRRHPQSQAPVLSSPPSICDLLGLI